MKNKGITLMEMVAVITIMAIAIPVLLRLQADVSRRSIRAEGMSSATFYAQEKMEEMRMKDFTSIAIGNTTDAPGTGYTRTVSVEYVTLSTTTWITSAGVTNYKHIKVSVSRTDSIIANVDLDVIMVGGS